MICERREDKALGLQVHPPGLPLAAQTDPPVRDLSQ